MADEITRRSFVKTTVAAGVAAGALAGAGYELAHATADPNATEESSEPIHRRACTLNVNGQSHELNLEDRRTLLLAIRDDLKLTGTKKSCNLGQCGACTVLLDGEPAYSCIMLAADAEGKKITTIEGLAQPDGKPHIVQQAWMEKMGSQCGHCSPGMIMSAVALLNENPHPSEEEIRHALSGNLCRCGNYVKEVAAVMHAAAGLPNFIDQALGASMIGMRPAPRVLDSREKACGTAAYAGDVKLPEGMLHAKVLRSPVCHANIDQVDLSRAAALKGVIATLHWDEVPNYQSDRRFLNGKARYAGDAIAAVAAEDAYTAQHALELIGVSMSEIAPVFDAEAALRNGTRKPVHDGGEVAGFVGPQKRDQNTIQFTRGDAAAALKQADMVVEGKYITQLQCHVPIEPHCVVAKWDADHLTLWDSQQSVHNASHTIARALNIPEGNVRVIAPYIGGGFGGKCTDNEGKTLYQGIAAMLARKAKRPVRLEYTQKELMYAEDTRNPFQFELRVGVKRNGDLTAIDCRAIQPTGGYASSGPAVCSVAGEGITNTYKVNDVRYTAYSVYTNTPVGGELRGFGHPQAVFALETHMDKVAEAVGMNPLDFRMRHHLRDGDHLLTVEGEASPIRNSGLEECLEKGAAAIQWRERWQPPSVKTGRLRRGLGMRMSQEHSGRDVSNGLVAIRPDGKVIVPMGLGNLGTQAHTGVAILVAEMLGFSRDEMDTAMEYRWADSGTTAWDFVSDASRGLHCVGKAFLNAALDAREQLIAAAAKKMGTSPAALTTRHGRVAPISGGAGMSFADVVKIAAPRANLIPKAGPQDDNKILNEETGAIVLPEVKLHPQTEALIGREFRDCLLGLGFYAYNPSAKGWGAGFAEVEVDMESGRYRIIQFVMAHDVGKVIHQDGVEAQIYGGGVFGLGYATTEELIVDPHSGIPINPALQWYRPLTMVDYPPIVPIIVENPDPAGPLGAKGLGENPVISAAPAIANAIYNAAGVRLDQIPLTWARVHEALRAAGRLM